MRSIPGTITEYPGNPGIRRPLQSWAYSDRDYAFYIPSKDPEVVANVRLVLDDLLRPTSGAIFNPEDSRGTAYLCTVGYTTHYERVHKALANVADHHGLGAILWQEVN